MSIMYQIDAKTQRTKTKRHTVDGIDKLQHLPTNPNLLHFHFRSQIATGNRGRCVRDGSYLEGQLWCKVSQEENDVGERDVKTHIRGHGVDTLSQISPSASNTWNIGLTTQNTLRTDFTGNSCYLCKRNVG